MPHGCRFYFDSVKDGSVPVLEHLNPSSIPSAFIGASRKCKKGLGHNPENASTPNWGQLTGEEEGGGGRGKPRLVQDPLLTIYLIPYTIYRIPYTIYRIPYTIYLIPYTLYLIPYT